MLFSFFLMNLINVILVTLNKGYSFQNERFLDDSKRAYKLHITFCRLNVNLTTPKLV